MAETEHGVSAKLTLEDRVTGPMGRIASAAQRVDGIFGKMSHVLGTITAVGGGIGAAFSLEKLIDNTKEHFESVRRIATLSHTAVGEVDGLTEAFAKSGMEADTTEHILLSMFRRATALDQPMLRMQGHAGTIKDLFSSLNINVRRGLVPALEQMATAYKKGKVDAVLLMRYGVPHNQVMQFVDMLKKGPKFIREAVEEGKKFGIRPDQMAAFVKMKSAAYEAAAAWKRIQIIVGGELLPVLADLMERIAGKIKDWMPAAKKFGEYLRNHFDQILTTAHTLTKVLLINFAITKATALVGSTGIGKSLLGHVGKEGIGGVGLVSRLLAGIAGPGLVFGGARTAAAGAAGTTGSLALMARIGLLVTKGTVLLFLITAVVEGAIAVAQNFENIRDVLGEAWQDMVASLQPLFDAFKTAAPAVDWLEKVLKLYIPMALITVMNVVEAMMISFTAWVAYVKGLIGKGPRVSLYDAYSKAADDIAARRSADAAEAARKRLTAENKSLATDRAARLEAAKERPAFNQNFYNARFDVRQQFAEGYDPDRIAVAFANDIATLGERRMQPTTLSPWGAR